MVRTRSDRITNPVERLREELAALDRAYSRGHHGRWSARRRAELVDACLVGLFEGTGPPPHTALVALGGYGRAELTPHSDIDLLLLHGSTGWASAWGARRADAVKGLAERLFYPLWDAGFTVGHAVRGVRECQRMAAERLDVATAMLDARLLAGEESLYRAMQELVGGLVRRDVPSFLRRLEQAAGERRTAYGSVSQLLEPELKEGSGGLRDIHSLQWAAMAVDGRRDLAALQEQGVMRGVEREAVLDADEFLIRLRSALHLETGKKTDRLHLEHQPWLATAMGFEDEPSLSATDALMRATFEHARQVEHVFRAVFERLLHGGPSRGEAAAPQTPEDVVGLFARAARGERLTPDALDRMDALPLGDEITWREETRDAFLQILRAGENGVRALEAMDRSGILQKLLPEWRAVRCRPQRDPFHRYTVDVHLLQTLAEMHRILGEPGADRLAEEALLLVGDRDALLLGAFLHDIGKTGHGHHVATGVRVASSVLDRIGVPDKTRELALFMIEEHLLLPDTATRRDLEDEDLVLDVAARVGDQERLAALFLLAVADAIATGAHAWTPWRAALVRDLVSKVQHVLERGQVGADTAVRLEDRRAAIRSLLENEDQAALDRFLERMPRQYLLAISPERAARDFHLLSAPLEALEVRTAAEPGTRPGTYGVTVVAEDRPGLLARIAGSLALSGLSILTAQVFTTEDGVAVDLFEVEGAFEAEVGEDRWRQFRHALRKAIEGRLSLEYRVREKRRFYPVARTDIPVSVEVDNDASDFFTIIEVGGPDRIGLLFDVTRTLHELELDVHVAKVATYGARVVDAFYVRDVLGRKVEDPEHVEEVRQAITARLSD